MNRRSPDMKPGVVALVASVLFIALPAGAQTAPTPAPSPAGFPTIPPGVSGAIERILQKLAGDLTAPYAVDPNHVRGVVTYFRRFDLQVRMPLDRYRDVHLHQGTIIDPRGATIAPGQVVDVQGRSQSDGTLDADAITIVQRQ
jgi:hypothetical protein